MAKKTEYVTDEELTNAVSQLLTTVPQLKALRDCDVVILCCMRVRMDDNGETEQPKGCPVKLKKLSDLERLFVEGNAHYILTMDYHFWKNSNERQHTAQLFDELMGIKVETSETGLKLKKRDATVTVRHVETVELFGAFDDPTLALREAMKNVGKRMKDFVDDITPAASSADDSDPEQAPESGEQPEDADEVPVSKQKVKTVPKK